MSLTIMGVVSKFVTPDGAAYAFSSTFATTTSGLMSKHL